MKVSFSTNNYQNTFKGDVSANIKKCILSQAEREIKQHMHEVSLRNTAPNLHIISNLRKLAEESIKKIENFAKRLHPQIELGGELKRHENNIVLQSLEFSHPYTKIPIRTTKSHYEGVNGLFFNNYIYLKNNPSLYEANTDSYSLLANNLSDVNPREIELNLLRNMIKDLQEMVAIDAETDVSFLSSVFSKIEISKKLNQINKYSQSIASDEGRREVLEPQIKSLYEKIKQNI